MKLLARVFTAAAIAAVVAVPIGAASADRPDDSRGKSGQHTGKKGTIVTRATIVAGAATVAATTTMAATTTSGR